MLIKLLMLLFEIMVKVMCTAEVAESLDGNSITVTNIDYFVDNNKNSTD